MDTVSLNDKQQRSRRGRNIALAITLAGLVILFYVVTLVKVSGGMVQ